MASSGSNQVPTSESVEMGVYYTPPGSTDPGWKYGFLPKKDDPTTVECWLCRKVCKGGIFQFKKHLAHIKGNVQACSKSTEDIRKEIKEYLEKVDKRRNEKVKEFQELRDFVNVREREKDNEDEDVAMVGTKKPRTKCPMDLYAVIDFDDSLKLGKMRQSTLKDSCASWDKVKQYVAGWAYRAGIPFHAFSLKSFHLMVEAIGQYGPGFKPPTSYELGEPLLKKEVEKIRSELQSYRDAWTVNGCSIVMDAWTDRKGRSIMNLCVHCEMGTSFLKSIDASEDSHTAEYIFKIVDECIEDVGVQHVIQVATDNAATNLAAARLLKEKRPHIFLSACAAHCIGLMLEAIGKESKIKGAIEKGRALTVFIYGHHRSLSMMRQYTQKKDIVRLGVTRFATSFLTLHSILEKKDKLRLMFSSDDWRKCKLSKTAKGEKAASTVLSPQFWNQVGLAIKVFAPLARVLRLVDSDTRPAMGMIYGGLEDAKSEIKAVFKNAEASYKPYIDIILQKSRGRLDSPLHYTGYYLNPYYYYKNSNEIERNSNVRNGFLSCLDVFYRDIEVQDIVTRIELKAYREAKGLFGRPLAVRQRSILDNDYNPAYWWLMYGSDTPHLQSIAMKILNLTCTSSGCERNWSTFEGIHTKKRNRLEVKKLNDLVYVQFNAKLKERQLDKTRDPLVSKDRDQAREWLVGGVVEEEEVIPGSGLTWDLVSGASGANEILQPRRSSRSLTVDVGTSRGVDEDLLESEEHTEDEGDANVVFDDDFDID